MQAEAEGVVALHDNFRNECAAEFCVWAVEEVWPILQQGYQLPRPMGGGIPLGIHKLLFVQLGLPELAGQLVAFGYKNVRINEAVLLEEGQRLILTGEFRYFFVEGNDVLTPEQSAITDRLEGFEHLLQNGEALMLELIVEAAEGFINTLLRDWSNMTLLAVFIVFYTAPVVLTSLRFSPKHCSATPAHDFSGEKMSHFRWRLPIVLFSCLNKVLNPFKSLRCNNRGMRSFCVVLFTLSFVSMTGRGKCL